MGDRFRDMLKEAAKKVKSQPKKGKMLKKLHELDDRIEDFIDQLEEEIIAVEGNPVFVKKAHQLLADMSKEYSEFIVALRAIVNAVDRKEKVLPAFEKQESRVRDVLDGQGNGPMEGDEPEAQEAPPEKDDGGDDEYELKVAKKGGKKKSGVKEALELDEAVNPKTDLILLGKEVNYAMGNIGLRPKRDDFKKAAKKLGITVKQAERAWHKYTWD